MQRLSNYLAEQNKTVYIPRGLMITHPMERGLRVVSFFYVLYKFLIGLTIIHTMERVLRVTIHIIGGKGFKSCILNSKGFKSYISMMERGLRVVSLIERGLRVIYC